MYFISVLTPQWYVNVIVNVCVCHVTGLSMKKRPRFVNIIETPRLVTSYLCGNSAHPPTTINNTRNYERTHAHAFVPIRTHVLTNIYVNLCIHARVCKQMDTRLCTQMYKIAIHLTYAEYLPICTHHRICTDNLAHARTYTQTIILKLY